MTRRILIFEVTTQTNDLREKLIQRQRRSTRHCVNYLSFFFQTCQQTLKNSMKNRRKSSLSLPEGTQFIVTYVRKISWFVELLINCLTKASKRIQIDEFRSFLIDNSNRRYANLNRNELIEWNFHVLLTAWKSIRLDPNESREIDRTLDLSRAYKTTNRQRSFSKNFRKNSNNQEILFEHRRHIDWNAKSN